MSQAKRFTENKFLKLAHRLWDSNRNSFDFNFITACYKMYSRDSRG